MATKVFMEALSPTMEEGRLVKWLKNEGDAVKNGDSLAEVETDKAIMELVARGEGILRKRLVAENETRPVGQLVGIIAAADENIDALIAGAGAPAPAAAPAASAVPTAPAAAPSAPATTATPVVAAAGPAPTSPAPQGDAGNGGHVRSSPLARRLASERGLNLSGVQGSGPGGRIIKRDVESAATQTPAAAPTPAKVRVSSGADFDDVPLTQIRKTIAKRLSESIGPIPTFYLTAEFDLSRATEMRAAMLEMGDAFKVSVNDIVIKAVATALSQHPEVNAHWLGDKIRLHNRVHIGVAVATDDGLIVPVITDADQKRMSEISAETRSLAKRARERKLAPEEYTGATFTISNLGMFGIDHFTAIINPPEVAILAIGASHDVVVSTKDGFAVKQHMSVTMSCDHRAVDGAVGAAFLQTLRRLIENPLMLVF
ncbi:MAG: pyruvate dehydrogenase complex dihydrolipoamide acetyltransferase [Gemmatimonadaceae bacterium]